MSGGVLGRGEHPSLCENTELGRGKAGCPGPELRDLPEVRDGRREEHRAHGHCWMPPFDGQERRGEIPAPGLEG